MHALQGEGGEQYDNRNQSIKAGQSSSSLIGALDNSKNKCKNILSQLPIIYPTQWRDRDGSQANAA